MKLTTHRNVEDILFEQGLLTADQLAAVKLEHANTGKPSETILVERHYVSSRDLTQARGKLLSIPYTQLSEKQIPTSTLDVIPEAVARKYRLIPFEEKEGELWVAMVDPLDLQVIEFLEKKSGYKIKPFISEGEAVEKAISDEYGKSIGTEVTAALQEVSEGVTTIKESIQDFKKVDETIRDAPVARIVGTILEYAVKARASDVHIEPMEEKTRVRYRIDGILQDRLSLPKKVHGAVTSRIKILSNLKIDERRVPQDGRFKINVGGTEVDLRVSTLPTVHGEKVVIRLLKEEGKIFQLSDLGLRGIALKRMDEGIRRPNGVILVTGPTGSGKTLTLASLLSRLNTVRVNIITLEDPVEIRISGVNQVQVNPLAGLTFASGLRSFLRQDPNVIMVGEVRDTETAELAVHAALTGHLVLSTIHTNSAAGALPRLIDMGVEAYLMISTVNLILAQRLVRLICPECKESFEAEGSVVEEIRKALGNLYPKKEKEKILLYKGKGCQRCEDTGYQGRTGIFEALTMSDRIATLVLEKKPSSELEAQAIREGMITLLQDGYLKVLDGLTTLEEVMRVAKD